MGIDRSLAYFLPELVLTAAILAVILLDLVATASGRRGMGEGAGRVALLGAGGALVDRKSVV